MGQRNAKQTGVQEKRALEPFLWESVRASSRAETRSHMHTYACGSGAGGEPSAREEASTINPRSTAPQRQAADESPLRGYHLGHDGLAPAHTDFPMQRTPLSLPCNLAANHQP